MWRDSGMGGHTTVTAPNARGNPFEEPPIPQDVFNQLLNQLIYDTYDDSRGVHSALRGQSLARLMYGWVGGVPNPTPALNLSAFAGVGRPTNATIPGDPTGNIVNYTFQAQLGGVIDPERYGAPPRTGPSNALAGTYIPKNAPYTYPDLNN